VSLTVILALLIGLIAGILAGVLGIGGSIVTIPGMVLVLGVNQHMAQGIALSVIVFTALIGGMAHQRQKNVATNLTLQIAPSAIIFSLLGAWIAGLVPERYLTLTFGTLLLIIGFRVILQAE